MRINCVKSFQLVVKLLAKPFLSEKEGLILKTRKRDYVSQIFSEAKTISKNIGLVTTNLDDYIFCMISGVEKVLSSNGYNTTLRLTRNRINNERGTIIITLKIRY